MAITRRHLAGGAAGSASALAFLGAFPASAAAFVPSRLIGVREAWSELEHVNRTMGPTRLTGSPEHQAFVAWLKHGLEAALGPAGGQVFEDRFDHYPRWSARRWDLTVDGEPVPVASYYPYCTGGFTGARSPLIPAARLAAAGEGGHYPKADGIQTRILPPVTRAGGALIDLGLYPGAGPLEWGRAQGRIALVGVDIAALSKAPPANAYTVDSVWANGRPGGDYINRPAPVASIFSPPDLGNATKAGVLGVVLIWKGVSAGNAKGQYNPFTVPFSSFPPSRPSGSDPAATRGGLPALWVDEATGQTLARKAAAAGAQAALTLDATIEQVSTSTVWALLPGARDGQPDEEFLVCNSHSDGPNIAEENGGLAVVHMARYFAQVPQAERPKTMVFMISTGHFGHRFLGSGRDWIAQHPQITARTAACLTLEHFGCREWQDVDQDGRLRYAPTGLPQQSQILVTAPDFKGLKAGPPAPALQHMVEAALATGRDRAALLSGGLFLGEGGGFHDLGIPTVGFLPAPQYLCAMADDGEISKLDPAIFHDQLQISAKVLLSMQAASAAEMKGV